MLTLETLKFSIDNHIARIFLNRPDAANGINLRMAEELLQALITCEQEKDLRAILIHTEGKMFCAGGDVKSFAQAEENMPAQIRQLMVHLHSAISVLTQIPVPVIIAVNGTAAGAGFSLACAGDVVIAAESAKFTMAYTAIGLSPDAGSTWHLPRLVGLRRAQELMLTNRRLSAKEAQEWGIVTQVVSDDKLQEEVENTVTLLAQGATRAYASVKNLLHSSFSQGLDQQLEAEARAMAALAASDDGINGVQAFVNKQAPTFIGK